MFIVLILRPLYVSALIGHLQAEHNIYRSYYSYKESVVYCTNLIAYVYGKYFHRLLTRDCEVSNRKCNHLVFNIKMLKCGCYNIKILNVYIKIKRIYKIYFQHIVLKRIYFVVQ
jgi:hypothetical protein